jgi:hypothetical protein
MAIFLAELVCPNMHSNAGTPLEYASVKPPDAWLETMCRDFWRSVMQYADKFPRCNQDGCASGPVGPNWKIVVSASPCKTIAELMAHLEKSIEETLPPIPR